MVPTRGLFCPFTGDRAPAVGIAPVDPPLPRVLPFAPHSAPPEPALGAQTWVRPGPSAGARVFPRVPGDAGPEAGLWGGTR